MEGCRRCASIGTKSVLWSITQSAGFGNVLIDNGEVVNGLPGNFDVSVMPLRQRRGRLTEKMSAQWFHSRRYTAGCVNIYRCCKSRSNIIMLQEHPPATWGVAMFSCCVVEPYLR